MKRERERERERESLNEKSSCCCCFFTLFLLLECKAAEAAHRAILTAGQIVVINKNLAAMRIKRWWCLFEVAKVLCSIPTISKLISRESLVLKFVLYQCPQIKNGRNKATFIFGYDVLLDLNKQSRE